MWIKICGLTTPEAVSAALAMGVDAVGFVFAASPRRVTPEFAAQLAKPARRRACCVAVVRHPVQAEIDAVLKVFAPDVLQGDLTELAALRLPRQPRPTAGAARREYSRRPHCPDVSCSRARSAAAAAGRTGTPRQCWRGAPSWSWPVAWTAPTSAPPSLPCGPFGVDVSSGVEERPGVKSPAAIKQFVQAARAAATARE